MKRERHRAGACVDVPVPCSGNIPLSLLTRELLTRRDDVSQVAAAGNQGNHEPLLSNNQPGGSLQHLSIFATGLHLFTLKAPSPITLVALSRLFRQERFVDASPKEPKISETRRGGKLKGTARRGTRGIGSESQPKSQARHCHLDSAFWGRELLSLFEGLECIYWGALCLYILKSCT
jgi:hypothetical protein